MSVTRTVELEISATGYGSVKIDGEVVKGVRGVDIRTRVGEATEVTLHLIAQRVVVKAEADVNSVTPA